MSLSLSQLAHQYVATREAMETAREAMRALAVQLRGEMLVSGVFEFECRQRVVVLEQTAEGSWALEIRPCT